MSSTFTLSEVPILEEVAHQLSQQKVAQQLSEVSRRHAELEQAQSMEKKTLASPRPDGEITAKDKKATTAQPARAVLLLQPVSPVARVAPIRGRHERYARVTA